MRPGDLQDKSPGLDRASRSEKDRVSMSEMRKADMVRKVALLIWRDYKSIFSTEVNPMC